MKNDQTTRACKKCRKVLQITDFPFWDASHTGRRHECLACNKKRVDAHHTANRAHRLARAKVRYAADPLKFWTPEKRARANELACVRLRVLRDQVVQAYGGKCACCGITEPLFLTIDHVDNNGSEMRKIHRTGASLYRWLIKRKYPKGFQVLCMSCNFGKSRNGGVCPHVSKGPTIIRKRSTAKRPEAHHTPRG